MRGVVSQEKDCINGEVVGIVLPIYEFPYVYVEFCKYALSSS